MPKFTKRRSKKSGLPPGTLVHIGEKKTEQVKITVLDYDESDFQEKEIFAIDECFLFRDKPSVTWINADGVHNLDILEKLGDCYG
ncbi:MAG: magnesium and cobalt transport protein CorA, partial [Nitrospirae bacterium]|nr:magnesium and cobalt transport protein CorA [Nitrospirota bacterium]